MVRIRSWSPATRLSACASGAGSSRRTPRSLTAQPSRASIAISMKRFESKVCAAAARHSGRRQLIAGRKHRNADAPDDVEFGQPERRGERHILWPQTLSRLQRDVAFGHVLTRRTHIRPPLEAGRKHHPPRVIKPHVLLHEDRVGALRHRRAGENPGRATEPDRRACRCAGLNPVAHGNRPLACRRQVVAAHGIAIDGGIGEGRQRQRRCNVACENPPVSLPQGHGHRRPESP